MPDPYRRVRPGEPTSTSAEVWNAMLDAARAEQARRLGRAAGDLTTPRSGDILRVRNATGTDLGRAAVLGLSGPVWTPADGLDLFLREVAWQGVVPAAGHAGKFCVLLEPARAGRVVRAYCAGVCAVRLNVTDPMHPYAEADPGSTARLASGDAGSALVLWRESDGAGYYGTETGEMWAIVRFGPAPRAGTYGFLAAGDTINGAAGMTLGTGVVQLCSRATAGAACTADGPFVSVFNAGGQVTAGSGGRLLSLGWKDGDWSLDVFPCA